MPGAQIQIEGSAYPDLNVQEGDKVKIVATVDSVDEQGAIQLTTDSVEPATNPAQRELNTMMPKERKRRMAGTRPAMMDEDEY